MYDRKLLSKLSQCAWKVLSEYLKQGVIAKDPVPGAVISVQTFGDFLNFNPHLHIIATDGCFSTDDEFMIGAIPNPKDLEDIFRIEVFRMLKKEGKINDAVIENMMNWHHSGFHVYAGEKVEPTDEEDIERLAQYIVRAPISEERMTYIPANENGQDLDKVIYKSKNLNIFETFAALDWLARLVTHIPNKGEQLVRYYGYYSNKSRGVRKKMDADSQIPALINSEISKKRFHKNWARLIQKIYKVDPLLCPKCNGHMRIISFIEEKEIIKEILVHLNLWLADNHDPPDFPNRDHLDIPNLQFNISQYTEAQSLESQQDNITVFYAEEEYFDQMPYEDEYSQLTAYDECI